MSIDKIEVPPLIFHNQREITLYHHHHVNGQLALLERTTALGSLANQEAMATAQYTMSQLDRELERLPDLLETNIALTPYHYIKLHQLTIACMVKLAQNAVWLDARLTEILLR